MIKKAILRKLFQSIILATISLAAVSAYGATAKSYFSAGHSAFQSLLRDKDTTQTRKNRGKAIQNLLQCCEANPRSPYVPKAIYYLGRIYELSGRRNGSESDLRLALKYYGQVVANYPKHGWADDSLYRRAEIYELLHEPNRAQLEYAQLIDSYPKSNKITSSATAPQDETDTGLLLEKPRRTGFEDVLGSTVSIDNTNEVLAPDNHMREKPSPVELYANLNKSVHMIFAIDNRDKISQGSAVAVTDRLMLSNHHVIKGMDAFGYIENDEVVVLTAMNGSRYKDILVAKSPKKLTPVNKFRSYESLNVGETVYALGSPQSLNNTFSQGIISGLREYNGLKYIQITAPVSQGSSGGGVFDEYGKLIGITTMMYKNGQNLNLAISLDEYIPYIKKYLQ